MTQKRQKSKHWCFTINNYTQEDAQPLHDNEDKFDYFVAGKEVGEDGTPHMQGYCVMVNRAYLTAMKKLFPRAHLEIKSTKSTYVECIAYCKKDGDFMEFGTEPIDNKTRTKRKWESAFESAKKGNYEEIPKDMLIRYYHAFKRIRQDNPDKPKDLESKKNYWIVAPTQYGKSHYARERWPDFYDKGINKWWTGYKGQPTVLCDDFGPKECQYLSWYMKRWADLYAFPMETKGGGAQIRPTRIVVTSQYTIDQCFEYDEKVMDAMKNRYNVIELEHWKKRIKF